VGVNILKDVRYSSVLYICKYFVVLGIKNGVKERGGEDKSGNGLENKMEKSTRGTKGWDNDVNPTRPTTRTGFSLPWLAEDSNLLYWR
jgi:hypothetical protein